MKKIISLFIISFAMVMLSITACAATPFVTEATSAKTLVAYFSFQTNY